MGGGGGEGRSEGERERLLRTFLFVVFPHYFLSLLTPKKVRHMSLRGRCRGGGSTRGRGLLAEGLIDEAATCSWTGHMILSANPFFLCLRLRFPGDLTMTRRARGRRFAKRAKGGGAWRWTRGAPPEREQLFPGRSASHRCPFPVWPRLPNYVLGPPSPFLPHLLLPPPCCTLQDSLAPPPELLPSPRAAAAAVGGRTNSVWFSCLSSD